ncbi:uncharacterized protein LOC122973242 isoform X2 [Thunnus albacares]|uniref:uncharacterized protein LOC122973242 isoform X2 n=1 Tax=Thunnus albacares TaxID=8236 RepID=UPI001CF6443F|nr:uncharacterized protein LOC122973242 isoform X2 [Thunnus albacares]
MRLLLTFCSLAFCLPSVSNLTQKGWPGQCATTFLTMTGSLRWSNLKRLLVLWIIPGVTKDLWMKDRERKLYNSTNTPPSQPWHRVESSVPSQVAEQLAYYVHVSETPYREKSIKDNYTSNMYRYLASLTDDLCKKAGNIVLYIPKEGLQRSPEEASKDKKPVQRLENQGATERPRNVEDAGHLCPPARDSLLEDLLCQSHQPAAAKATGQADQKHHTALQVKQVCTSMNRGKKFKQASKTHH